MDYFANCRTLADLKREYRRLVLLHHPDRGGDTATMQAINAEHDAVFERLRNAYNASVDEAHQSAETPEEYRAIIDALLHLDGLEVELCGSWLWIGGDTRRNKEALKAAGCRWSSSKKLWYWRPAGAHGQWSHGQKSMAEIRTKYGSQPVGRSARRAEIGAAYV